MSDRTKAGRPSHTLPKTLILSTQLDIERILKNGQNRQGRYAYVRFLRLEPDSNQPFRVAFVCARRIGNAVTRNRCRRRMREIIRRHKHLCEGYEFLLFAKPAMISAPFERLADDVSGVLKLMKQEVPGS